MVVRRGEVRDIGAIVRLEHSAAEAPQWGETRYLEMLTGEKAALQRVLLVVEDEIGLMGFAVGTVLLGEAELEGVVVGIEFRRRGVGRMLCEAVMEWARGMRAVEIRLEVRAGNLGAQGLYQGLGFAEDGRRRGYYARPAEDAVLMRATME